MPSDMSMNNALIVGSKGQDGLLMAELLENQGIECVGIHRGSCDIANFNEVLTLIQNYRPKYLFYFAAHHTSATEEQNSLNNKEYFNANTIGVLNFLDAIKLTCPNTHFFFTSSSLIFKPNPVQPLNEESELELSSLYAISKYASMKLCEHYRDVFGLKTTVGIMFNHESRYRKNKFVSRKIVDFVVAVKKGSADKLSLGNLDTIVDWGAAEDYMSAIYQIVKEGKTGDYVISTGHGHTLRQFCEVAFSYLGLNYEKYLSKDSECIARVNNTRIGDSSKLISDLNWKSKISFEKMIQNMIDYQMDNQS